MFRAAATALVLLAVAPVASALDLEQVELRDGRRVVVAKGEFVDGDSQRLGGLITLAGRIDEVWFHSGGGLEIEGYRIGKLIRQTGLATRVPKGAKCASACTDAFLGGMLRFVDDERSVGIHMPTASHNQGLRSRVQGAVRQGGDAGAGEVIRHFEGAGARSAADWTRYVMSMGVSIRLVDKAVQVPANQMHWLSRSEMRSFNVTNASD